MDTLVRWECEHCGHVYNGMVPPSECPNCGSPREQFKKLDVDPVGKVFVAEEHIPQHVNRWECDACGLVVLRDEQPTECSSCGASREHFHQLVGEPIG